MDTDTYDKHLQELQDQRGHLPPCKICPVSLVCMAGRAVGLWCQHCYKLYVPRLKLMLVCDAANSLEGTYSGTCPVCNNGEEEESLKHYTGVEFDWPPE